MEHDPEDLWQTTVAMFQQACERENVDPVHIAVSASLTSVKRQLFGTGILDVRYTMPLFGDRRTADYCRFRKRPVMNQSNAQDRVAT